jgi:hypothetical protein
MEISAPASCPRTYSGETPIHPAVEEPAAGATRPPAFSLSGAARARNQGCRDYPARRLRTDAVEMRTFRETRGWTCGLRLARLAVVRVFANLRGASSLGASCSLVAAGVAAVVQFGCAGACWYSSLVTCRPPGDGGAGVAVLLHGDVGHEPVRGGSVPVVLAGLEEDSVAGADDLDWAALSLAEAGAFGEVDRLAVGVGVPGGAGAGVKCTAAAANVEVPAGAATVSM